MPGSDAIAVVVDGVGYGALYIAAKYLKLSEVTIKNRCESSEFPSYRYATTRDRIVLKTCRVNIIPHRSEEEKEEIRKAVTKSKQLLEKESRRARSSYQCRDNKRNTPIIVAGAKFRNAKHAAEQYRTTQKAVVYRCESDAFPSWQYA